MIDCFQVLFKLQYWDLMVLNNAQLLILLFSRSLASVCLPSSFEMPIVTTVTLLVAAGLIKLVGTHLPIAANSTLVFIIATAAE